MGRRGEVPPLLVVALGGNALQDPAGDDSVQADLARTAATGRLLAGLIVEEGWRLVVTHGNGPQVGNHLLRSELAHVHGHLPDLPLDVCVADTQGGMGYMLQQCLGNALTDAEVPGVVASVVTQVVVEEDDPAFEDPSKPVGELIPEERANVLERQGWVLRRDRRRGGFRRVVASPDPVEIVEATAVKMLVDAGVIVVAAGGGGVPVVQRERGLAGVPAVVDKDLSSGLLAADLGADALIVLTDVEHVLLDAGTPNERPARELSVADARSRLDAGEFPPGSMGPKIEAVCRFVETTGRLGAIGHLDRGAEILSGETGTHITF